MNSVQSIGKIAQTLQIAAAAQRTAAPRPSRAQGAFLSGGGTPAPSRTAAGPDRAKLVGEVERVAEELGRITSSITFSVDEKTGDLVVRVMDSETEEVVRQIPPEDVLEIRRKMSDYLGMLADETA